VTTQTDFITNIPDTKPVRIFLPIQGTDKRHRERCIFQQTTPPRFHLLFEPGTLPAEDLDSKSPCIISLDMAGHSVSIEAMITQIINSQVIELIARKTITHEQMREYFRVDYTVPILTSSRHPEEDLDAVEKYWQLSGTVIDLSGSGLLAIFHEEPPADKLVRIQLALRDDRSNTLSFLARPVRISEVEKNRYVVAYHFEEINDEDRDKIIGQCLITQRRLLRLNVQVKDQS
jgi:hypothetical protein